MSTREKRPRRETRSTKAIAELNAAKKGSKRSEQYVYEKKDVYEEVNDEEYEKLVAKNKSKPSFVEDDDKHEYDDGGEVEWEEEETYSDEELERPAKKIKDTAKKGALFSQPKSKSKPKKKAEEPSDSHKLTALLLGAASNRPKESKSKENLAERINKAETITTASLIDDILNDPGQMLGKSKKKAKRKRTESEAETATIKKNNLPSSPYKPLAKKTEPAKFDVIPSAPAPIDQLLSSDPLAEEHPREPAKNVSKGLFKEAKDIAKDVTKDAPKEVPKPLASPAKSVQQKPVIQVVQQKIDIFSKEISDSDLIEAMDIVELPHPQPPTEAKTVSDNIVGNVEEWRINEPENHQPVINVEHAPLFTNNQIQLYWIDALEDKFNNPGTVYLFGKVLVPGSNPPTYFSCCVTVNNIDRVLFVAPKPGVDIADVTKEIQQIRQKHKIKQVMSKPVKRTYSFDDSDEVSREEHATFLKVLYSAKEPVLPQETTGETFSHIFGTQTSALEHFLLKLKLMGPCWLKIQNYTNVSPAKTWCKMEVSVEDIKCISKLEENLEHPPLVVLSMSMKAILNLRTNSNEIVSLSLVVHSQVSTEGPSPTKGCYSHFSLVRKLDGINVPMDFERIVKQQNHHIQLFNNERLLISAFLEKLESFDPDILMSHNFIGFDLDVLLHRMNFHKIFNWSVLGRLRRGNMPKLQRGAGGTSDSTWEEKSVTAGRLICDSYLCAKDLIREKNYKLSELAKTQLNVDRVDVESEDIPKYFGDSSSLINLVKHTENDAYLALSLMFKLVVIPLTKQLASLSGNLWSRSLNGGRAERIEYLLLHEFHNLKYIPPDKKVFSQDKKNKGTKKKKADYKGGLVLEPKKGFYDKIILLLDFNSLYPSIIQEYNICFTTIERKKSPQTGDWELAQPPDSQTPLGILPKVIKTLVDRRKTVKGLLKTERDPVKLQQLDIRQRALKLTANSMYGCLGFSSSRFYAKPLAELITRKGRETLEKTVHTASASLNLDVIYGDTDSIMINTGLDNLKEALEIGQKVKKEVNKASHLLEIEIDGVFKPLLLRTKKKYAAISIQEVNGIIHTHREVKGLDLVRRDWCDLSKEMANFVLDEILSGKLKDELVDGIHTYLRQKAEEIKENKVPLSKFIINKSLTKSIEDYPDAKAQPHVQVAIKLRSAGKSVRVGDHIQYVICQGDAESFAQRAFHPDQVLRSEGLLQIDTQWYLSQQIHPPILRLCEGMAGTDSAQLADCLGLDPSRFKNRNILRSDGDDRFFASGTFMDDEEKFKDVEKLKLSCQFCQNQTVIEKATNCACTTCKRSPTEVYLVNKVDLFVRKFIQKFYEGWLVCEEQSCKCRTRQLHFKKEARCIIPGCKGHMTEEYSRDDLYKQLLYLQNLFADHALVKALVEKILSKNGLRYLDLSQLLQCFHEK